MVSVVLTGDAHLEGLWRGLPGKTCFEEIIGGMGKEPLMVLIGGECFFELV